MTTGKRISTSNVCFLPRALDDHFILPAAKSQLNICECRDEGSSWAESSSLKMLYTEMKGNPFSWCCFSPACMSPHVWEGQAYVPFPVSASFRPGCYMATDKGNVKRFGKSSLHLLPAISLAQKLSMMLPHLHLDGNNAIIWGFAMV